MSANWNAIETAPEGVFLETKIDDWNGVRNVSLLRKQGRLWFMEGGMYVYYTPTHWRLPQTEAEK